MPDELTRIERRTLRQLAATAYARELDGALKDLHIQFVAWRAKRIDGFALSEAIHEFHQGIARDLWYRHQYMKPHLIVRVALEHGILRPNEVPPTLRERFLPLLE